MPHGARRRDAAPQRSTSRRRCRARFYRFIYVVAFASRCWRPRRREFMLFPRSSPPPMAFRRSEHMPVSRRLFVPCRLHATGLPQRSTQTLALRDAHRSSALVRSRASTPPADLFARLCRAPDAAAFADAPSARPPTPPAAARAHCAAAICAAACAFLFAR